MSRLMERTITFDDRLSMTICFIDRKHGLHLVFNKWTTNKQAICAHHADLTKGESLMLADQIYEHYGITRPEPVADTRKEEV